MPRALYEAIGELERSEAAGEIFGEDVVDHYLNAARVEQEPYDAVVHDWDRERYLERAEGRPRRAGTDAGHAASAGRYARATSAGRAPARLREQRGSKRIAAEPPAIRRSRTSTPSARASRSSRRARRSTPGRASRSRHALYRIAEAASAARTSRRSTPGPRDRRRRSMYAENFYIALYDDARARRSTSRITSTRSTPTSRTRPLWEPFGVGNARGTTAYVLRTGRPTLITPRHLRASSSPAARSSSSASSATGDWLGAPLSADGRTLGVARRPELLGGEHVHSDGPRPAGVRRPALGIALSRVRAIEETRQRNAELAAGQRDRRTRSPASSTSRRSSSSSASGSASSSTRSRCSSPSTTQRRDMITFPYEIDEGERDPDATRSTLGAGPDLARDPDQAPAATRRRPTRADRAGRDQIGGTRAESWLGVPILAGTRVIGVLALESVEAARVRRGRRAPARHARDRAWASPSRTPACSTRPSACWPTRTSGRPSWRVINEIGAALARAARVRRDHRAGRRARPRRSFDARSMFIALHDPATEPDLVPVRPRRGRAVRPRAESSSATGLTSTVIQTGRPLRLGTAEEQTPPARSQVGGSTRSPGWACRSPAATA